MATWSGLVTLLAAQGKPISGVAIQVLMMHPGSRQDYIDQCVDDELSGAIRRMVTDRVGSSK